MAGKTNNAGGGLASFRPDEMSEGGLPDDFDGGATDFRLEPWDYNGKLDHYVLALACEITPDEASELKPFTQHWSLGDLDQFRPSKDGRTPVDVEGWDGEAETIDQVRGTFAKSVGDKTALSKSSNGAFFIEKLIEAGFDVQLISGDVSVFDGIYGHWNRVPQKKRSNLQVKTRGGDDDKKNRSNDVLILTEILDKPATATKGAAKGASKKTTAAKGGGATAGAPSAATSAEGANGAGDDDFSAQVALAIMEVIAEKGEMQRAKLMPLVSAKFTGAEKSQVLRWMSIGSKMEGNELFNYDPASGVVSLPE